MYRGIHRSFNKLQTTHSLQRMSVCVVSKHSHSNQFVQPHTSPHHITHPFLYSIKTQTVLNSGNPERNKYGMPRSGHDYIYDIHIYVFQLRNKFISMRSGGQCRSFILDAVLCRPSPGLSLLPQHCSHSSNQPCTARSASVHRATPLDIRRVSRPHR